MAVPKGKNVRNVFKKKNKKTLKLLNSYMK